MQSSVVFPFQDSRLQIPFSRVSEIQPVAVDADRIAKTRELNFKLKKVHGKLDTMTGGLGTTLTESMEQVGKSCQSVKALANEQTKLITQLTFDFQQHTGQISRRYQTAISDVEGSFRAALSMISSLRQYPLLAPAPVYQAGEQDARSPRHQRVQRRSEVEIDEDQQPGIESAVRKWRSSTRRARADRTRIAQQFRQLKQQIPED
jgi:hypothetical protein